MTYMQRLSIVRRFVDAAQRILVPADFAVSLGGVDARPEEVIGLVVRLANGSPVAEQGAAADAPRR